MDPTEAFEAYAKKFGTEPGIAGIGDTLEGIVANVWRAVETGRPLWTFYYDEDPAMGNLDI